MRRLHPAVAVLFAGLLVSGAAFADTPLPDPPFAGGGLVPLSKVTLKQEINVLKVLAKYAYKRTYCDTTLLDDLILAYTSANGDKIIAVQTRWGECVSRVGQQYADGRNKAIAKGTPACLDSSAIDAIRDAIDAQLEGQASVAFCDGDNAAPDPATLLNVPDKVKEGSGEIDARKVIMKSYYNALKCLAYVLPRFFRDQLVSDNNVDRFNICLAKIESRAMSSAEDLDQTQKLPSCLPPASIVAAAVAARDFGASSSGALFCSSPSGAFVDGAPVL